MHEQSFTDPLNDPIFSSSFAEEQQKMKTEVNSLHIIPYLPLIVFFFLCLMPVAALLFMIFVEYQSVELFMISFVPAITHYTYIKSLEGSLVTYLLCKKNNWAFNPTKDTNRAKRMAHHFQGIFARGEDAFFTNQIWGNISAKKENAFWCSMYSYRTGQGRNSSRHEQQVLIIELDKKLPMHFSLYRYGEANNLETESEEFNNLFKINYVSNHIDTKRKIIATLSPSVQVRLIDFAQKYSLDCITFQHNCMIILFSTKIWKAKHTNFFKRVIIDERDVKAFDDVIKDSFALPSEMIRFLD